MKPVPHQHPGEVELCYDAFCARITTSERNAANIGAGLFGAILGGVFGKREHDLLTGAVLGGLLAALSF